MNTSVDSSESVPIVHSTTPPHSESDPVESTTDLSDLTIASEKVSSSSECASSSQYPSQYEMGARNGWCTIEKLPSAAKRWQMILQDIIESKEKRLERIKRKSENIVEFINRFPIMDMS